MFVPYSLSTILYILRQKKWKNTVSSRLKTKTLKEKLQGNAWQKNYSGYWKI